MANFETALTKTLAHEGGYVNDPKDPGGETYCGISRKTWPKWEGWVVIDAMKQNEGAVYPSRLLLDTPVSKFYHLNFWTPLHGDEIESQEIANYLLDFSVNSGIGDAVKAVQYALNKYFYMDNQEGSLKLDGVWGDKTQRDLDFLHVGAPEHYENIIVTYMRTYRLAHYMECIADNPKLARFARGWARRALA